MASLGFLNSTNAPTDEVRNALPSDLKAPDSSIIKKPSFCFMMNQFSSPMTINPPSSPSLGKVCAEVCALTICQAQCKEGANTISRCVEVVVIISGCTNATYHKVLRLSLGIQALNRGLYLKTIEEMFPILKSILDQIRPTPAKSMPDCHLCILREYRSLLQELQRPLIDPEIAKAKGSGGGGGGGGGIGHAHVLV